LTAQLNECSTGCVRETLSNMSGELTAYRKSATAFSGAAEAIEQIVDEYRPWEHLPPDKARSLKESIAKVGKEHGDVLASAEITR
jgi:hypothetical protein